MKTVTSLVTSSINTPLGTMIAVADEQALYMLVFQEWRAQDRMIDRIKRTLKADIVSGSTTITKLIERELKEYFAGSLHEFTTPIALLGTPFQKQVWNMSQKVPFGKTCSYAQLATVMMQPTAFRAVANASGQNQLAIIVPCHRILKSNGDICGYSGGLAKKQWLIEHEAKQE